MTAKTLVLLTILCALPNSGQTDMRFQPHATLYQTVKDFVANSIDSSSEYEVSISPVDTRLKLPLCSGPLQAFIPNNRPLRAGRLSIGVSCDKTEKWSIFTSVTLKIYADVVILSQPVRRGQILTRRHLAIEKRNTARLRNGYIDRIDLVENKQVTRHLPAGTVLNQALVSEPALVKRGEKIVISATAPSYDIRMQGLALMDGIKGQSIKVKNVSSGRTIAAKVVKQGLVSVIY